MSKWEGDKETSKRAVMALVDFEYEIKKQDVD